MGGNGQRPALLILALCLLVARCSSAPPRIATTPVPPPAPTFTATPVLTPTQTTAATSTPTATVPPLPSATPVVQRPVIEHVLLISLDGLRPEALLWAETPHLDTLWQEGAYTWRAQTVLPSVTLVSHASMLSGVGPEVHGITWNDWRPQRGYIQVPTIFSVAHQAGFSTAMFVGKRKLEHLARPGTVDTFQQPGFTSWAVAQEAADYLVSHRPTLLFVHLPDPDAAGHAFGWLSGQQLAAVEASDEAVGLLLAALHEADLSDRALVIVSADHGGHRYGHGTADPADMTIPWIAWGANIKPGYEIAAEVHTYDTAATVLYALGLPIPSGWEGRPLEEIFTVAAPAVLAGGA